MEYTTLYKCKKCGCLNHVVLTITKVKAINENEEDKSV